MYKDFMLKFDNKTIADSVLFVERETIENGEMVTVQVPKYSGIDVIGVIYKPTGVIVQSTYAPFQQFAPIQGWHVNVRNESDAPEIKQYEVNPTPDSPERTWF